MPISIEFDIDPPLERLKYWIEHIEREVINDLSDFWDGWARKIVVEETARIFATEGYGMWSPLSTRYKLRKSTLYPGRTMLRARDVYFRASTRKGYKGNLFESLPSEMTWGVDPNYFQGLTGFPYPAALETGAYAGKANLPPRPVWALLAVSTQLHQNLVKGLNDYLHKKIKDETKKVFR